MKLIRDAKTNRTVKRTTILAVAAALLLTGLALHRAQDVTLAQTGGGYDLTWSTIDGGGYTFSTGGGYSLGGTVGQPDAGGMTGGGYTLDGGFWGAPVRYMLYLPLVLRDYQ